MKRIPQLDGLRGIAFLSVFFCHAYQWPLLWMGVDLFFVMSGFLITQILLGMKGATCTAYFREFYTRRALRILPPYVLFILLVSCCVSIDWQRVWPWYAFFAANIAETLKHGGGNVLTPLWSLAVEEQFYLIWPVVVYVLKPASLKKVLVGLIVTAPVLRFAATFAIHSHWPIYFLTPFRMDLLSAGSLLAIYWNSEARRTVFQPRFAYGLIVASVAVFYALSRIDTFRTGSNSPLFNALGYSLSAAFFAGVVGLALAIADGPVNRFLVWRPLRAVGGISYMLYLVHALALKLCHDMGVRHYPLAALPACVIFCAVSWRFYEHPILQLRSRVKETSRSIAAPATVAASAGR